MSDSMEFNVVIPGRERCDAWVELDEVLEEAEAFLSLGAPKVIIEQRKKYRGDMDLDGFLAGAPFKR